MGIAVRLECHPKPRRAQGGVSRDERGQARFIIAIDTLLLDTIRPCFAADGSLEANGDGQRAWRAWQDGKAGHVDRNNTLRYDVLHV